MQKQRNASRAARPEPDEPARLSWQRQPSRSRRKTRKMDHAAPNATAGRDTRAAAPHRKSKVRPRAEINWGLYGRLGLVGLMLICLGIGLGLLARWPALKVVATSTLVGGNSRISGEAIYEASGLQGRSVLFIRPREAAAAIAKTPGIAAAAVQVRLPNQAIIDVREEVPLVAWQGVTTTVWLSAGGAEVPQVGALPPLTLTDLTGTALAESQREWAAVLADLAAFQAAQPAGGELLLGKLEGLHFCTADGAEVWLGRDGGMAGKLALLEATQRELAGRGQQPSVIDLRFSDKQAFVR